MLSPFLKRWRRLLAPDLITVGPGSVVYQLESPPNLLFRGIAKAIAASLRATTKVYICNLMTQANESLGTHPPPTTNPRTSMSHAQGADF